jgi:hypothetical protein
MKLESLTTVKMPITVLWVVTPPSTLKIEAIRSSRTLVTTLQIYMASQPRRLQPTRKKKPQIKDNKIAIQDKRRRTCEDTLQVCM